jgi:hypothetical protein
LEGWNVRRSQQVLEWQAEATQTALLHVLKARFRTEVSDDLIAILRALREPDELAHWLDEAAVAKSLDAFRDAVLPRPLFVAAPKSQG